MCTLVEVAADTTASEPLMQQTIAPRMQKLVLFAVQASQTKATHDLCKQADQSFTIDCRFLYTMPHVAYAQVAWCVSAAAFMI